MGCPLLRKYLTEEERKGSNPESSLLLHKSQKFLKTHGNPRSDIYSSLLSHCTILTLTRPCGNKHIRTGTDKSPVRRLFTTKTEFPPNLQVHSCTATNTKRLLSEHSSEGSVTSDLGYPQVCSLSLLSMAQLCY